MSRRAKIWTVLLGVLVAVVLVADRGAQYVLEKIVADEVQNSLATSSKPSVDLGGFPFLPELVRQKLDFVELDIEGADAGKVEVARVHAVLHGVKQRGGGVQADSISGDGLVAYSALSAAAKPLTVGYGGDGLVELRGSVSVAGQKYTAGAAGRPRIDGNELVVKPERASTSVGGDAARFATRLPEVRVPLRDIPDGLRLRLNPTESGVEFTFDGTDVFLSSADATALGAPAPVDGPESSVSSVETVSTRPRATA